MSAFMPTAARLYLQLRDMLENNPIPVTVQVKVPDDISLPGAIDTVVVIKHSFDAEFKNFDHEVLFLFDDTVTAYISVGRTLASEVKAS